MSAFIAAAIVIFVCGFSIARIVNVFLESTTVTRDAVVTLFQGIGLAAVLMMWNLI